MQLNLPQQLESDRPDRKTDSSEGVDPAEGLGPCGGKSRVHLTRSSYVTRSK